MYKVKYGLVPSIVDELFKDVRKNFLLDRYSSFFAKRRKSAEEMTFEGPKPPPPPMLSPMTFCTSEKGRILYDSVKNK